MEKEVIIVITGVSVNEKQNESLFIFIVDNTGNNLFVY